MCNRCTVVNPPFTLLSTLHSFAQMHSNCKTIKNIYKKNCVSVFYFIFVFSKLIILQSSALRPAAGGDQAGVQVCPGVHTEPAGQAAGETTQALPHHQGQGVQKVTTVFTAHTTIVAIADPFKSASLFLGLTRVRLQTLILVILSSEKVNYYYNSFYIKPGIYPYTFYTKRRLLFFSILEK